MFTFQVYLFLVWISLSYSSQRCTSNSRCTCTPLKSGIRANCSRLSLLISPNFTSDVVEIDLTFNILKRFPSAQQIPKRLQTFNISNNNISVFEGNPFAELTSLITLDLSNNHLTGIPPKLELPKTLKSLNLSNNTIDNFLSKPFRGLKKLAYLDLSKNNFVVNNTIFFKEIFEDLKQLKELNIGFSNQFLGPAGPFVFPEEAILSLTQLVQLTIDGVQNQSFGSRFVQLKNFIILKIAFCTIVRIDSNYFDNLPNLEEFHMLAGCKNYYNVYLLNQIDAGTFNKLRNLRVLDISNNRKLGLCGLWNITRDLPHTKISVLKANYIQCPSGRSSMLLIEDLKPLNKTNITELHLDGNKLEMTESWAVSYLPKTLRVLSVKDNRWTLFTYAYQGINNLTGLNTIDLRYQGQHIKQDMGDYFLCDDFYSIHKCEEFRLRYSKHEWLFNDTDLSKFDCPNTTAPMITPTACVYANDTCETFFNVLYPPNTTTLRYDDAGLTNEIRPIYFNYDTLETLTLSSNELYIFTGPLCNVSKVKTLDLSRNRCSKMTTFFLGGFRSLKVLNLNENELGNVMANDEEGNIFVNQTVLEYLNISSNKIAKLPRKLFKNLYKLKKIDASKNSLSDWNVSISHMKNLSCMDLSNNEILFLSETSRNLLDESNLKFNMDLSGNNFQCNCDTLPFLRWVKHHERITFVKKDSYVCKYPDRKSNNSTKIVDSIQSLEQKCASQLGIIIGTTLSLTTCLVTTIIILVYRFRWKLRYWYHVAKQDLDFRKTAYIRLNRRFDLFVSFAEEDGEFVYNEMIEQLEEGNNRKLKLCVHKRDFIPGTAVADNIVNAIHNSSKTVCLISRAFIKSSWCMYEFNIALTESVQARNNENILILVLMEQIPHKEIPLKILEVMKNETYIEYPQDERYKDVLLWSKIMDAVP